MELEQGREDLKKQGLGLVAISYDPVGALKHFADRKGIRFALLSDESSSFITSLGILNTEVPKTSEFHGIPHPVTYLVDEKGVIRKRIFETDYRQRFTVGNTIGRQTGVVAVPAKRLQIKQSVSDALIHGGQRFKLRLELQLPAKSHVYAPGVEGYIPIDWKLAPSPAFEPVPMTYPLSKRMYLKAIKETVVVYEGKLVLEREIIPAQRQPAGDFRIEGSLRYQVCDDKQCFVPETVPLAWTLKYEPHDSTRVPAEMRRRIR